MHGVRVLVDKIKTKGVWTIVHRSPFTIQVSLYCHRTCIDLCLDTFRIKGFFFFLSFSKWFHFCEYLIWSHVLGTWCAFEYFTQYFFIHPENKNGNWFHAVSLFWCGINLNNFKIARNSWQYFNETLNRTKMLYIFDGLLWLRRNTFISNAIWSISLEWLCIYVIRRWTPFTIHTNTHKMRR